MEAYVIAYITNEDTGEEPLVRVLNLENNASRTVNDIKLSKFIEILNNGTELPGITAINNRLYYYGFDILDYVPTLKTVNSANKRYFAIRQKFNNNGLHQVILIDYKGMPKLVYINSIADMQKRIPNVKFLDVTEANLSKRIVSFRKGTREMILVTPDNRLLKTINSPVVTYEDGNDPLYNDYISLGEFNSEMLLRGYPYQKGPEIYTLDVSKGIVNIPRYATEIDLGTSYEWELDKYTFRIPNTVFNLKIANVENIKDAEFIIEDRKNSYGDLNLSVFSNFFKRHMEIDALNIVPNNTVYLNDVFYGDITKLLKFSQLYSISDCFYDMELKPGRYYLPNTLKYIYNSFNNLRCTEGRATIVLPENLEKISGCFTHGSGIDVDFSYAKSLKSISDGTLNDSDVTEIDILNSPNLERIENFAHSCDNLTTVKIGPGVTRISNNTLSWCPKLVNFEIPKTVVSLYDSLISTGIQEITVGSQVNGFDTDIPKIIFEDRNMLSESLVYSLNRNSKLEFNNIKMICTKALSYKDISDISFKNVESLREGAMVDTIGKELNMYNWECQIIPFQAFEKSSIKTIILPKNTLRIEKSAFYEARRVEKLFIPEKVNYIDKTALFNTGVNNIGGLAVYVIKDSYADKFFAKKKFRLIRCESYEDALDRIHGVENLSSEKTKLKMKLVTSASADDISQSFMDDEHIDNVKALVQLHNKILESKYTDIKKIPFDMKKIKVIYTARNLFDTINKYFVDSPAALLHLIDSNLIQPKGPDELTNQFKILTNLITSGSNTSELMSDLKNIDTVLKNITEGERFNRNHLEFIRVYEDNMSAISRLIVTHFKDNSKIEKLGIWFVMIGSNIVYVTTDTNHDDTKSIHLNFCYTAQPYNIGIHDFSSLNEHIEFNMDNIFNVGDTITLNVLNGSIIGNLKITKELNEIMINPICEQCILVSGRLQQSSACIFYICNMITGTLYKCNTETEKSMIDTIRAFRYLNIIGKESYNNWSQQSKKDIASFILGNNDSDIIFKKIINPDRALNELKSNDGAFDPLDQSFEWSVGALLHQSNIEKLEDLNGKFMAGVFTSGIFGKIKKSENELDGYSLKQSYTLKDGSIICTYRVNGRTKPVNILGYDYYYFSTLYNSSNQRYGTDIAWIHNDTLDRIFTVLYNCYNDEVDGYGYIDGTKQQKLSFNTLYVTNVIVGFRKLGIAVNKKSGGIYLISINYDKATPLFRFRNLTDAIKFTRNLYVDAKAIGNEKCNFKVPISNANYMMAELARHLDTGNDVSDFFPRNVFSKLYELMINGYPNGYNLDGIEGELWKLVAKQPKEL